MEISLSYSTSFIFWGKEINMLQRNHFSMAAHLGVPLDNGVAAAL
jgi:hypothetical protein